VSESVKVACADCMRETWHEVLHTEKVGKLDKEGYCDRFDTLQCRGCRRVSLREVIRIYDPLGYIQWLDYFRMPHSRESILMFVNTKYSSEELDNFFYSGEPSGLPARREALDEPFSPPAGEDIEDIALTEFYPASVSRRYPEWAHRIGLSLPEKEFLRLFHEIYVAIRNGLPQLAVMGIRAVLEHIIISKVGDHGRFELNIAEFHKQGYISTIQFDSLRTILELGHAVIHRSFSVAESDLNMALDIMEGILAAICHYEDTRQLDDSGRIPPRPQKRKPPIPRSES
jgi:hypothetical protein